MMELGMATTATMAAPLIDSSAPREAPAADPAIHHHQLSHANATAIVAPPSPTNGSASQSQSVHRSAAVRGRVGRPSSKFGTVNYSIDEMRRLNEKVRAVVPVAGEDWLHVAYQFNYMRPESIPYREVDSLKRKFKKMYCSRGSVGGKLPDYIQEAKELRLLINQRSERSQIQLEHANSDSPSDTEGQAGDDEGVEATTTAGTANSESLVVKDSEMTGDTALMGREETRDIAARLQTMEDEYHQSIAARRGTSREDSATRSTAFTDPALASRLGLVPDTTAATLNSTSGIIQLLKQSIERKRRTAEELLLSESERVRKERKKRKMEQTLYNIHRESEQGTGAISDASDPTRIQPPLSTVALLPSAAPLVDTDASSSLGIMDLVLQFMMAQQQETAKRVQEDEERRQREAAAREVRRKAKDAQRRKDTHELMLVMSALLQDSFPTELRHYLVPPDSEDTAAPGSPPKPPTNDGSVAL